MKKLNKWTTSLLVALLISPLAFTAHNTIKVLAEQGTSATTSVAQSTVAPDQVLDDATVITGKIITPQVKETTLIAQVAGKVMGQVTLAESASSFSIPIPHQVAGTKIQLSYQIDQQVVATKEITVTPTGAESTEASETVTPAETEKAETTEVSDSKVTIPKADSVLSNKTPLAIAPQATFTNITSYPGYGDGSDLAQYGLTFNKSSKTAFYEDGSETPLPIDSNFRVSVDTKMTVRLKAAFYYNSRPVDLLIKYSKLGTAGTGYIGTGDYMLTSGGAFLKTTLSSGNGIAVKYTFVEEGTNTDVPNMNMVFTLGTAENTEYSGINISGFSGVFGTSPSQVVYSGTAGNITVLNSKGVSKPEDINLPINKVGFTFVGKNSLDISTESYLLRFSPQPPARVTTPAPFIEGNADEKVLDYTITQQIPEQFNGSTLSNFKLNLPNVSGVKAKKITITDSEGTDVTDKFTLAQGTDGYYTAVEAQTLATEMYGQVYTIHVIADPTDPGVVNNANDYFDQALGAITTTTKEDGPKTSNTDAKIHYKLSLPKMSLTEVHADTSVNFNKTSTDNFTFDYTVSVPDSVGVAGGVALVDIYVDGDLKAGNQIVSLATVGSNLVGKGTKEIKNANIATVFNTATKPNPHVVTLKATSTDSNSEEVFSNTVSFEFNYIDGQLVFKEIPGSSNNGAASFANTALPTSTTEVKRDGTAWNLSIENSLATSWAITATASNFVSAEGKTLLGSLIYKKDADNAVEINDQSTNIVSGDKDSETNISGGWNDSTGVLLEVDGANYIGNYSGTVEWTLTDTVQPE